MSLDELPELRIPDFPQEREGVGVAIAGLGKARKLHLLTDSVIEHHMTNFNEERAKMSFAQARRKWLGTDIIYGTTARYTPEDAMAEAAGEALDQAGLKPDDVAEIHISTIMGSDHLAGPRSTVLEKLGIEQKTVYDLRHACAGSLYALSSARRAVRDLEKPVLAIAGDDVRKDVIDLHDWAQSGIFGAGFAAAVLTPTDPGKGLQQINTWTDPRFHQYACMDPKTRRFHMDGKPLGEIAPKALAEIIDYMVKTYQLDRKTLYVGPHQFNGHKLEDSRVLADFDRKHFINIVNQTANPSNPSILLAAEHAAANRLQRGDTLLFVGFGMGFDFGTGIWYMDKSLIKDKTIKVLLADDNQRVLDSKKEIYTEMLPELVPPHVTLDVYAVTSGEEAVEKAAEIKPDLLDFDMRMGYLTGADAAMKIQKDILPVPVIINTAFSEDEDRASYDKLRLATNLATDYIMKNGGGFGYAEQVTEFLYLSNLI